MQKKMAIIIIVSLLSYFRLRAVKMVYTAVQLGTNATKRETLAIKVATQTPGFS
jgi:hypothetical protein